MLVILVIAGSTSAGGCMDLYAELVRNNMVDAIVATGATIVDMDFFEALGHKHYQALEIPDDDTLRSLYIDRIYDTYIDERSCRRPITRSATSPTASSPSLFVARVHQGDGQVADDARQEGEQPRQARLRA
jgi:deoxyhypusine synthase